LRSVLAFWVYNYLGKYFVRKAENLATHEKDPPGVKALINGPWYRKPSFS